MPSCGRATNRARPRRRIGRQRRRSHRRKRIQVPATQAKHTASTPSSFFASELFLHIHASYPTSVPCHHVAEQWVGCAFTGGLDDNSAVTEHNTGSCNTDTLHHSRAVSSCLSSVQQKQRHSHQRTGHMSLKHQQSTLDDSQALRATPSFDPKRSLVPHWQHVTAAPHHQDTYSSSIKHTFTLPSSVQHPLLIGKKSLVPWRWRIG